MGALPKRRISSARRGKRRAAISLKKQIVKHYTVKRNKRSMVETLKKALGFSA
jgi:ribosomal protein L32